jgi:hypothetical protein
MDDALRRRWRLALFLVALLLFNFPVLTLVDRITTQGGVPVTPWYLLAVWMLTIAAAAWLKGPRA